MKFFRHRYVLLILAVAAALALIPATAHAATGFGGAQTTIGRSQTINDDVYAGGSNVTVDGRINGNLIAAGGAITVNGTVTGVVIAAGGNMTINGTVDNSVIVAGGTLVVNGNVKRDVTYFGGDLTVGSGATVGRDVTVSSGTVTVNGHVARNVRSASGTVTIGSRGLVGGNLIYSGDAKPKIANGGIVRGKVQHQAGSTPFVNGRLPWSTGLSIVLWLRSLTGLLALGTLFVFLAPVTARRATGTLNTHPLSSFAWGALAFIVVPIVAFLVFLAGLFVGGWWISFIALGIYTLGLLIGIMVSTLFIGRFVLDRLGQPRQLMWLSLLVGLVLLLIVSIVPVLGGLIMLLAALCGLGALLTVFAQSLRGQRDTTFTRAEFAPSTQTSSNAMV